MKHPESFWTPVGHFYAPIAFYDGCVLKYQGECVEGNKTLLEQQHPAGVILESYKGDRILAADYSPFTGTP